MAASSFPSFTPKVKPCSCRLSRPLEASALLPLVHTDAAVRHKHHSQLGGPKALLQRRRCPSPGYSRFLLTTIAHSNPFSTRGRILESIWVRLWGEWGGVHNWDNAEGVFAIVGGGAAAALSLRNEVRIKRFRVEIDCCSSSREVRVRCVEPAQRQEVIDTI